MNHTIKTVADRVTATFQLDFKGHTRIQRVLRNMLDKAVLESALDESDARGTRRFSDSEAAIALLLFPLARMAVEVRTLRQIASQLRGVDTLAGATQIERLLVAARNGTPAHLIVSLVGIDTITARIAIDGQGPEDGAAEILSDYQATQGTPLAVTTLPATMLLSPLVTVN